MTLIAVVCFLLQSHFSKDLESYFHSGRVFSFVNQKPEIQESMDPEGPQFLKHCYLPSV